MSGKYVVDGEIYPVSEVLPGSDPDWYEYRVWLMQGRRVIAEWDSLTETYNGIQQLTQNQAIQAIKDIQEHVASGNDPRDYFTF